MKPYYDDGTCTIYHSDCREVLPRLSPESVDLLLTDPPYGIRWQSGNRQSAFLELVGDDGSLDVGDLLQLALRVLRNHRHVYVFGRADLSKLPLGPTVELIWDKGQVGLGDNSLPWGPSHEPILFAMHSKSAANRVNGDGRLAARLRRGSVIRVPRYNSRAVQKHPTEKPVDLLRQLIESSSILGDIVLDPFMGSGSTLEAAKLEGRRAIGIEVEERYCEVAAKRLGQEVFAL